AKCPMGEFQLWVTEPLAAAGTECLKFTSDRAGQDDGGREVVLAGQRSGANVNAVQRMLGHAKPSIDAFRRRPGRRGCEPGRRNSSRCRRGPRGRDPVSLPVTAVWAAVWPPPVGCCGLTAGRVFCDDLSAN